MRKHTLLSSLLLSLALLLSVVPSTQGFSVQNRAQQQSSRSMPPYSSTTAPRRGLPSSQDALVVQKSQATAAAAVEKPRKVSHFLKQHKVVLWTSLVVAAAGALTRQVAWQGLRRDMLAGTMIFMVGDWGAQLLTHYKGDSEGGLFFLDQNRFVISALLGTLWAGIVNPCIYSCVENLLPGTDIRRVLMKMVITCSFLSTAGNYITMMFRRFLKESMESKPRNLVQIFKKCIKSCNADFMEVLKDDLKIWPLYDITCYSCIPKGIRPITNALMASAWSMYMSIASAKTAPAKQTEKESEMTVATAQEKSQINVDGDLVFRPAPTA